MAMCKFLSFTALLLAAVCCNAQQTGIKFNDNRIKYSGRVAMQDSAAILSWSANAITINFAGTGVNALLKDERGDNYYVIIVDGKTNNTLHPGPGKRSYTLVSGLPTGRHSLELFKRTEWPMGKTWFYNLEIEDGKLLSPPAAKRHKIEYYGDSITCGYADQDSSGKDRGTSAYENGYLSYAAITARHFNAEFSNISKSGIGVLVSWFPLIMPEMYDRLDANDPNSKWDFKKYTPQLIIINLFQNDSWITTMHENEQFKARFGTIAPTAKQIIKAYADFVQTIRGKYPNAQIICALGSMDATRAGSPWPGYIEKAVTSLNDPRIYTLFFPYKNTPGHPNLKEQQAMADELITFIDGHIKW